MKETVNHCVTNDVLPKQVTWSLLSLQGLIFLSVSIISLKHVFDKKDDPQWKNKNCWKKFTEYKNNKINIHTFTKNKIKYFKRITFI